jgi:hypothetical protein
VDRDPFFPGNQVVGMGDDLLFRCPGHTVTGGESEDCALIRSEPGSGVAFHDPGNFFTKTHGTHQIRPALGMTDIMNPAPADIMEHGTLFKEMKIDIGVVCGIPAGTVPHCPAMGNDLCAAAGIAQQFLAAGLCFVRHGQATF